MGEVIITEGWFNWIEAFPIWLQLIIGLLVGMLCIAIICFSIMGIQKITNWLIKLWNSELE